MVPVFEHSFLNSSNSLLSAKNLEISWSTDRAKNENPNKVSGLVVKHFISFIGISPSVLNEISQPLDSYTHLNNQYSSQ